MTLEEDIMRVLTQTRDEIRANMASKGINASGRTSASLEVQEYNGGMRLVFAAGNVAPMETLEIGRPGGKVPYEMTDIIVQWSKDKGLNWGDEKQRRKIAGAVAWGRIRKIGTQRHWDKSKRADIYSTPVERAKERLRAVVGAAILAHIKEVANTNF